MAYTIKQWRGISGLTQAQLAKAIGTNKQTVSNWECGKTEPKYSDLVKMAQVMNTGGIQNIFMPVDFTLS